MPVSAASMPAKIHSRNPEIATMVSGRILLLRPLAAPALESAP